MPDSSPPLALTVVSRLDHVFPTLTPAQIARIAQHGQVRKTRPGEVLVEAGAKVVPFFVVTAGEVEVVRPYDAVETVTACLEVCRGMIASSTFDTVRMRTAIDTGHLVATELADYLVAKNVPFREAHDVAGHLVRVADERGLQLAGLELATLREAHPLFDADVAEWLDPARAVDRRDLVGGPARERVLAEIARITAELE